MPAERLIALIVFSFACVTPDPLVDLELVDLLLDEDVVLAVVEELVFFAVELLGFEELVVELDDVLLGLEVLDLVELVEVDLDELVEEEGFVELLEELEVLGLEVLFLLELEVLLFFVEVLDDFLEELVLLFFLIRTGTSF